MKLIIILVLAITVIQCDCRRDSWYPSFLDTFTNKTFQISNYVKEKGQSIRNYYVANVRNKISYYLGKDQRKNFVVDTAKQMRKKRKFKENMAGADLAQTLIRDQAAQNSIFDYVPEKKAQEYTDDPAIHMTTPQIIAQHGYHAESHTIVTDDGYILTIHRIPFAKNSSRNESPRKTVLLHHGLLGSSADWIVAGPQKSLAYILSEAGYDVWMANVRGNTYSRAHVSRNIDEFAFWNFSFHEVSQHDLPAVIDYIMDLKGWDVKINYVGHSMGTTVLFAMLSTKPQYNKILRAGFALAPVAYMTDIKSPIRLLARFSGNLEYLMKLLGANQFLPQNSVMRWLSKHVCEINHYEEVICENSMFVLCGHDEKQFNRTLLPIILGHVPAGASTKTLIHYAQEIHNNGRFQMFDYGSEGNLKEYGTKTPPEYPVHQITLPMALISSQNDWLASDMDVTNLYVQLANPIIHYVVPSKEFNHIDFLWAIDAPALVYAKLLQLMEEGVSNFYDNININTIEV